MVLVKANVNLFYYFLIALHIREHGKSNSKYTRTLQLQLFELFYQIPFKVAAKHVVRGAGLTLLLGLSLLWVLGRGKAVTSEGMVAREQFPASDCVEDRMTGWSVGEPGRALAI